MELCSGNFSNTQVENTITLNDKSQDDVTDSQLMDLCSGQFMTQPAQDESSQNIKLTLDENEQAEETIILNSQNSNSLLKTLENEEQSFGNALDLPSSSVLETPKQALDKDNIKEAEKVNEKEKTEFAPWTKFVVVSSSDEEGENSKQDKPEIKKKKKKKMTKRKAKVRMFF